MPFFFGPDPDAEPQLPWNVTYLSQRDVELTIPIPFVTAPGVSLTAACFPHGRYEDDAAAKCLSNLLVVGFRRLHVDIYWDAGRHVWSLCPVQVPGGSSHSKGDRDSKLRSARADLLSTYSEASGSTKSRAATLSTRPSPTGFLDLAERQLDISSAFTPLSTTTAQRDISKATLTVTIATESDRTFAVVPTHTPPGVNEVLYSIGPYICSRTSGLHILNGVLGQYLAATDNTLEAVLKYIILNVHAAASAVEPNAPAPKPLADDLPSPSHSLSTYLGSPNSAYLLTPAILRGQRSDLNESWYLAKGKDEPVAAYYSRKVKQNVATTPDGWPSESVMEFQSNNQQRLVLGFGTIDSQMQGYDRSRDEHVIFGEGYMEDMTNHCIYNAETSSLAAVNNSWAVSSISGLTSRDFIDANYNSPLSAVTHLTRCGISPLLNQTLLGVTADTHILPYKEFAYSSIWSWAWGEPKTKNDTSTFRCAVLDPSSNGRWRVRDCSDNFRAACRIGDQPYRWMISDESEAYSNAVNLCPDNSTFDVPRTALETRYLLHTHLMASNVRPLPPIWIDFNSIDIEYCWVSGRNATCPYVVSNNDAAQIYVPTIAGLIIVIVAALLLLVKCGANRRNSRRRRRGADGWDYEGVPS